MEAAKFDLDNAWAGLAEMIGWIIALFGAPGAIAAHIGLTRRTGAQLLAWLAPLEALARRLLFIEAASLPAPNAPAPFAPRGRIVSALRDAPCIEPPEDSALWRVMFRVAPGSPAASPRNAGAGSARPRSGFPGANAAPLARRLEALLRLAQNRAAALARLARRLHAAPARTANAFAPYRHPARACENLLAAAQACADRLRRRYADTT